MTDYDPHSWWRYLLTVEGSVLKQILLRISLPLFWCVGVVLLYEQGYKVTAPSTMHTLVGVAMGLLLVFRTNASYDRFWEGRKLIGAIVNNARDLARQTRSYRDQSPPQVRAAQRDLIIA